MVFHFMWEITSKLRHDVVRFMLCLSIVLRLLLKKPMIWKLRYPLSTLPKSCCLTRSFCPSRYLKFRIYIFCVEKGSQIAHNPSVLSHTTSSSDSVESSERAQTLENGYSRNQSMVCIKFLTILFEVYFHEIFIERSYHTRQGWTPHSRR